MHKHSKLQLHILNLYKKFLRASYQHPVTVKEDIRESFRKYGKEISKTNTFLIEYQVRRAERQLRQLKTSNISGVSKISIHSTLGRISKDSKEIDQGKLISVNNSQHFLDKDSK